jgi:DNA-binding NarL/FixJ family response regulator
LADDHSLFRDGLRSMLQPEMTCCEAETLQETLSQLDKHQDAGLILMDLKMPGMNEFDGLREVRKRNPDIPIIVVSMHNEPNVIRKAMSYGISGYIPKTHSFEEMQMAIDMVLSGITYIPKEVLEGNQTKDDKFSRLTRRQQDVYRLLMDGMSNQEIADKLYISLSTVKMHVSTILKTAGVTSRSQLLASGNSLLDKDKL